MEKDDIKKEAGKNLIRLAKEYLNGAEEAKKRNSFRLAIDKSRFGAKEFGTL